MATRLSGARRLRRVQGKPIIETGGGGCLKRHLCPWRFADQVVGYAHYRVGSIKVGLVMVL